MAIADGNGWNSLAPIHGRVWTSEESKKKNKIGCDAELLIAAHSVQPAFSWSCAMLDGGMIWRLGDHGGRDLHFSQRTNRVWHQDGAHLSPRLRSVALEVGACMWQWRFELGKLALDTWMACLVSLHVLCRMLCARACPSMLCCVGLCAYRPCLCSLVCPLHASL